ncbi:hypothetical protein H1P_50021 [Hyella patelloides LEGE 07179]|uniref:Uncharacterized protein n=1 Tax=Hyella patelloides LEGE 07179 TaxID=945734 RepID=A0A563VZG8_9CYAN|nr:hypothetical protein [Hyella patelloides]VEP16816.1 hypothetical protein H1P_50021 [Hyella patelloides LEGE 07179]
MTSTTTQIGQTKPTYQPVIKVSVGAFTGALVTLTSDPALCGAVSVIGGVRP